MTNFLHLYRQFDQDRLVYNGGEAPTAPAEAPTAVAEAAMPQVDTIRGVQQKFEESKKEAIAAVDKSHELLKGTPLAEEKYKAQVDAFKAGRKASIAEQFNKLNGEFQKEKGAICSAAEVSPKCQETLGKYRAKADQLLAKIKERLKAIEVQAEVQHRVSVDELKKPGTTLEQRIAARTEILRTILGLVQVPAEVHDVARAMAEVMEKNPAKYDKLLETDVVKVYEWFKGMLEHTGLIEATMKHLSEKMPKLEVAPGEKETFKKYLEAKNFFSEYPDGLARRYIGDKVDDAATALAMRFQLVQRPGPNPGDAPMWYYIDSKDPSKVYNGETLKAAVRQIVEQEMVGQEAVAARLKETKGYAEYFERARHEIADTGGGWQAFWNDMIDTLGELRGEDKEKMDYLAAVLRQTYGGEKAVDELHVKDLEAARAKNERGAAEKQAAAELEHDVTDYSKAREKLVKEVTLTDAKFEPKDKKFDKSHQGKPDVIEIKTTDGKPLGKIETTLKAPHEPRLTIFMDGGKEFTADFKSMVELQAYLTNNPDLKKIPQETLEQNQGALDGIKETLWGKDGKGRIGKSDLYLEAFDTVNGRVPTMRPPFTLDVDLSMKYKESRKGSEKTESVGKLRITIGADLSVSSIELKMANLFERDKNFKTAQEAYNDLTTNSAELIKNAREAAQNRKETVAVKDAIKLPDKWSLGDPKLPDSFRNDAMAVTWPLKNANGAEVGTIHIGVTEPHKITLVIGGVTTPNIATPAEVGPKIEEKVKDVKDQKPDAPPAPEGGPQRAERVKQSPELEAVRPKLTALLIQKYPAIFSAANLESPINAKIIDAILRNLQNNKDRLATLTAGQDFDPSDAELTMIQEEIQKARGWEKLDETDPGEIAKIKKLKRPDGKGFEELLGAAAGTKIAENLSRQYEIKDGKGDSLIFSDGTNEGTKTVTRLEDLEALLPEADRAMFKEAIALDPEKDKAKLTELQGKLEKGAKDQESAMQELQRVQEALEKHGKEVFGKMGFAEALGALIQLWNAIKDALNSNPPDFSTMNDVVKDLTEKRNPAEVMKNNQKRFERILNQNQPGNKPEELNQLLKAYLQPRGAEANDLFGEANAKRAGIDNTPDNPNVIASLARYRTQIKPLIQAHLLKGFGLSKITGITEADNSTITVAGELRGQKYEIDFVPGGKADIFKMSEVPKADDPKVKELKRPETATHSITEDLTMPKIKAALTGAKAEVTPPPADPAAEAARVAKETADKKVADLTTALARLTPKQADAIRKQWTGDKNLETQYQAFRRGRKEKGPAAEVRTAFLVELVKKDGGVAKVETLLGKAQLALNTADPKNPKIETKTA